MSDPIISIVTQPSSILAKLGASATLSVTATQDQTATLIYQWYKDGQAISGATSSTYTIASLKAEDSNVYSCYITTSPGSNTAWTNNVVIASSILDNIELQMKILMLTMTKVGGYNFDWTTVNIEDQARGTYPRAVIESPKEDNLDDTNGLASVAYTNAITFIIWVTGQQLIDSIPNPNFTIRSNLRAAEDDLKQLFGINYQLNGSCDGIMFRSCQIFETNKNDVTKPASARTEWLVRYAQDRITPLQYASS
jgi:hypothetical protein